MADLTRIVTLSAGGRPVVALDIENGSTYQKVRDSFKITPGTKKPLMASLGRRYAGSKPVGETHDNGAVSASWLISGSTADIAMQNAEAFLAQLDNIDAGRYLEWRPDGATYSVLFELRGSATWQPNYSWVQFAGTQSLIVEVTFPVAPVARLLDMEIGDDFSVDSLSDYTYDSGAAGNETVTGGELDAGANFTVENRAIHTARGYDYGDLQVTAKFKPGATITNFKAGVVVKRISATNYIEVYVDDNGTNSRLRIDKIVAGVRTNLATTNLATRVSNGTAGWVRGRIEGNVVTAEYFLTVPGLQSGPTLTNTTTLAGGDATTFGAGAYGKPGRVWIPQDTAAKLDDYTVEPFVYRNQTLPAKISLNGPIPGTAPALTDITLSTSASGTVPIPFALIAWGPRIAGGVGLCPFNVIEAETGVNLSNWAAAADANYRGGNGLKFTTGAGAATATAMFAVDPSLLAPDDFESGEVDLEIWARVELASTVASPKIIGSIQSSGDDSTLERYTAEWLSAGAPLTKPSSGTAFRFVRVGTVTALVDRSNPALWYIRIYGSWAAGGSGVFGLDYLVVVPARSRASSPTAKVNDTSYPTFLRSVSGTASTKRVRSDLSARVASANNPVIRPDQGLQGSAIELPPGNVDVLAKLSAFVPDDPSSNTTSEGGVVATVKISPTPRVLLGRV